MEQEFSMKPSLSCTLLEKGSAKQKSPEFAPNPNLSLNVGIRPHGRSWFVAAATFGVALQSILQPRHNPDHRHQFHDVRVSFGWNNVTGYESAADLDSFVLEMTSKGTLLPSGSLLRLPWKYLTVGEGHWCVSEQQLVSAGCHFS